MKKIYSFSLTVLAMAALAVSCNKNAMEEAPAQEPVIRTFTCTFAEPDSKVAINNEGKTTWEKGDQILIHGKYFGPSYFVTVTLTENDIKNEGKTASFTVDLTGITPNNAASYQCEYYAAYPASAFGGGSVYSSGNNLYYYNCFTDTNKPLMVAYLQNDVLTFANVCGVLSFVVDGDFDSYTIVGNNSSDVLGYSFYRVKYVPDGDNNFAHKTDGPISTISGSVVADGTTENKIYFPNGISFGGGFTIKFLKGGSVVKTLSTTKSVSISRSQYRPMGNITAYLKDYVAPSTHDSSIDMSNAIALDNNGNANCYIIDGSDASNAGQVFTFKAYKGNSTANVGTIDSAEVLWETWNNDATVTAKSVIAAVDFDKQDANDDYTIVLKMPETLHAGNALVAAKDAGDNILWSWHIWVPATSIADVDASNICGATMMDRNLGALEKVSTTDGASVYTLGMIYQWGRKDPFPGGKRITETWPNPATVAGTAPSVNAGTLTMEEAIAHPTVFASNNGGDWQTTSDMTRWKKDAKTENDPCPPGYRIPYGERNTKPLWNTSNIATAATGAGLTWETSNTGYWFRIADGDKELVFPFAGYVSDGASSYGIGYTQTRAAIWSLSDSSSKYHLNIRYGSTTQFGSTSAARGCSVRCVAE